MRKRRTLTIVVGILVVAIVAFVAVGLLFENSWPGRMLQGAGIRRDAEPRIFPAAHIQAESTVPQGTGLNGGLAGTPVTFRGGWDGWCKVWGTDPDHSSGAEYYAGTFRMTIEGQDVQGFCIDLHRTIETGRTYDANVYLSTEPELCVVYWILTHYSRDNPGAGLSSKEEGAAIQAALWHFLQGFQPAWDPSRWCYKRAVYERTMEIIGAAQNQCTPVPTNFSLSAPAQALMPGQTAPLVASVTDQFGQPFPGQEIRFRASFGSLGSAAGVTDAQGQVANKLVSDQEGTARVTVSAEGLFDFAVVDPTSLPIQRAIVAKPVAYSAGEAVDVIWQAAPTPAEVNYFVAELIEKAVVLRWETSSEIGTAGFNVYHGPSKEGPWSLLNDKLIASQVRRGDSAGGQYEWLHEGIDPKTRHFYLLEDVTTDGLATQHGPITP